MQSQPLKILILRLITMLMLLAMVMPAQQLISHTSQQADIFDRYSLSYLVFLFVYFGLLALIIIVALFPKWRWERTQTWISNLFKTRILDRLWWLPLVTSLALLMVAFNVGQRWELGQSKDLQLALLAAWLWFNAGFYGLSGSKRVLQGLGILAVVVVSISSASVFVEVIIRSRPGLIPTPVRLALPGGGRYLSDALYQVDVPIRVGYRFAPMLDTIVEFDPYDPSLGGINTTVGPFGDEPARPLEFNFVTDENGFLNQPPVNGSSFDIVIAGDSFLGFTAETHWVELLNQLTQMRVLNLSMPGWGTQAEAEAVKIYGHDKHPKWVVIAYFEGNDMWDAQRYEEKRFSEMSWIEHDLQSASFWDSLVVPHLLEYGVKKVSSLVKPPAYTYPIEVMIGDKALRLAFSDQYVGALSACIEDIERSRNFQLISTALLDLKESSDALGIHLVLLYIPSEEHIYLPFISDPELIELVIRDAPIVEIDQQGYLSWSFASIHHDRIKQCQDDQLNVLQSFAKQHVIGFLDLTPFFKEEAAEGVVLYNYSDTHWNSAGQTLAAHVVADYLLNHEPSSIGIMANEIKR